MRFFGQLFQNSYVPKWGIFWAKQDTGYAYVYTIIIAMSRYRSRIQLSILDKIYNRYH